MDDVWFVADRDAASLQENVVGMTQAIGAFDAGADAINHVNALTDTTAGVLNGSAVRQRVFMLADALLEFSQLNASSSGQSAPEATLLRRQPIDSTALFLLAERTG